MRNPRKTGARTIGVPSRDTAARRLLSEPAMRNVLTKAILSWKPLRKVRDAILRDLAIPQRMPALPPANDVSPSPRDRAEMDRRLADAVRGKVVLVTGGSSGIGLAAAQRIAAAGATTLVCGRDRERLTEAARLIGPRARAVEVDLSDLARCDAFVDEILREYGRVDVLVNNAGRSIRRPLEESLDRFHDFQRTMQLNYFGALRLTMALLPKMAARRAGHVVNISSVAVLMSAPRFSAYVASKAALDAWTNCVANEYAGSGIDFTTIHMPLVKTPMIAPTRAYDRVPSLSTDEAADMIVQAIVEKPPRIATGIGVLGDLLHTVLPGAARALMNNTFRKAA